MWKDIQGRRFITTCVYISECLETTQIWNNGGVVEQLWHIHTMEGYVAVKIVRQISMYRNGNLSMINCVKWGKTQMAKEQEYLTCNKWHSQEWHSCMSCIILGTLVFHPRKQICFSPKETMLLWRIYSPPCFIYTLLHGKGNHQQNKLATYRMGENICISHICWWVNIQNL